MLFAKVLSQTFITDIWRATATTSADYSTGVIFFLSAFGMPNNRLDTDNLTLSDHNNVCGGEGKKEVNSERQKQEILNSIHRSWVHLP